MNRHICQLSNSSKLIYFLLCKSCNRPGSSHKLCKMCKPAMNERICMAEILERPCIWPPLIGQSCFICKYCKVCAPGKGLEIFFNVMEHAGDTKKQCKRFWLQYSHSKEYDNTFIGPKHSVPMMLVSVRTGFWDSIA